MPTGPFAYICGITLSGLRPTRLTFAGLWPKELGQKLRIVLFSRKILPSATFKRVKSMTHRLPTSLDRDYAGYPTAIVARLVLLIALSLLNVRSSAQVMEAWATEVPVGIGLPPIDLSVQPGGQLHLFGRGAASDVSTVKLDANGGVLWIEHYDSDQFTFNFPIDQAVDGAGNVYILCDDTGLGREDAQVALLKYASDGVLLWPTFFPGTNSGRVLIASQLALDSRGRAIVAGYTFEPGGRSDFFTFKCETNGAVLWSARYDAGGYAVEPLLAVDHADNFYIAGRVPDASGGNDLLVVKYDANGQHLWTARHDNLPRRTEYPVELKVDAAGNVYVAGHTDNESPSSNVSRLVVVKFSASGQRLWAAYNSPAHDEYLQATAAALDCSANLVVLAFAGRGATGDAVLVKFSAAGHRVWAARYNSPSSGTDFPYDLTMDSSGNAYITGATHQGEDPGNPHATSYFTQKYDPSGNRLWSISRPSDPSFYNRPSGIGLDAGGRVSIAGRFLNVTNSGESGWLAINYVQTAAPGLPLILTAPANQTVHPRTTATFNVAATGNAPLSYQWRHNGHVLEGATNATLTLSNAQFAQRGGYSVDVSSSVGVVATAEAELVVLEPPTITRQPVSQTVFAGTEATFTVAVQGLEPFSYQWRRDGSNLSGATNAALVLLNAQSADAGAYTIVAGNIAGSITSQVAVLTVSTQVMRSWSARYDSTGGYLLNPLLTLDGAGLPVVTATASGVGSDFDFATFKHDLAGARLWDRRFNSASNHADYATALFTDASGNVYVAGHSLGDELPGLSVIKYNAAGQVLWSMTTNHPWRTEVPCVITADLDGNAHVAASDQHQQLLTFKFDPTGQLVWSTNFVDPHYPTQPRGIVADSAGNVFLGVRQEYYCCTDFLLVKYAPDGRELWRAAYDGRENEADVGDTLFAMKLDGAGNIYLAGQVFGYFLDDETALALAVVKFDGNGNLVWATRHRLRRPTVPVAFAVNPAGASWIAYAAFPPQGETQGYYASNRFSAIVHFGPDGRERWASVVNGGNRGSLNALAADAAGNAYLAGALLHEDGGSDLSTSRLDLNGNLLWTALYNGPANGADHGNAIAVGPTGDIFVAGTSGDENGVADVVLLKYGDNPVPGLPVINTPPGNIATRIGSDVTFTVTATGAAPLRYQWLFNGIPMPDGTTSSLTLRGLQDDQVGFYSVEVSNPLGTVRSPAARLEILPRPTIEQHPAGQASLVGGSAYFAVRAFGAAPLTYQWLFNGVPIPGATNATLLLENLQAAQTGYYYVRISDAAGAIFSQLALLVVSLAATRCEQWDYPAGSSNSTVNALIARDNAGNFYVAGSVPIADSRDFLVLKYSPAGQLLWEATHDYAGGVELSTAIAVDAMGNVIVTGAAFPDDSYSNGDYATVKYDPQGNKLWARTYAGSSGGDSPRAIATDQAGNIYVTGSSEKSPWPNYRSAYLTVKYAPDGTQLWVAEYEGPGQFHAANAILVDGAGDIYVTGESYDSAGDRNIATIKYNSSGNQLWLARWNQVSAGGSGLAIDSTGHVIVVGYSLSSYYGGIATIKYDANGNERWSAHYSEPVGHLHLFRTVAVDSAGNVVAAGEINDEFVTIKYDTDGRQLWTAHWGGPLGTEDVVLDLALDAAGNAYVTGSSRDTARSYLVTIKYSPTGTRLWLANEVDVNSGAAGGSLVLDGAGNVYLVGNASVFKYCQNDVQGIPAIQQPPLSQDVVLGSAVTFSVVASGQTPRGLQWRLNGQIIPGANNSTLLLSNVETGDAGNYTVEVFNALGSVVSPDATLAVHVPARITSPPEHQCVVAGSIARFQVTAVGESPITYQWSFAGQEIPGATNSTLLVSNVLPSQVGVYTVRVSNPFASATASASLSLLPNMQQLWARTFDSSALAPGVAGTDDLATASTLDSAGNLYIAVVSNPLVFNGRQDIFTLKYDTNGVLQWAARHGATDAGTRRATDIAVDAAGNVHIAMEEYSNTNAPALLKYSADGQLLWTARFPGAGAPNSRRLALDSSGNAYVIETLFRVMKVSPNGTRLWTAVRQFAMALDLTADNGGNIYVAGAAFAPHGPQPRSSLSWIFHFGCLCSLNS